MMQLKATAMTVSSPPKKAAFRGCNNNHKTPHVAAWIRRYRL